MPAAAKAQRAAEEAGRQLKLLEEFAEKVEQEVAAEEKAAKAAAQVRHFLLMMPIER